MTIKRAFLALLVVALLLPAMAWAQAQEGGTRATFLVRKDFTDDNPNEVRLWLSCNTGLPLDQPKDIAEDPDYVEFVIVDFDSGELDCTIYEEDFPGYEASYWAGEGEGLQGDGGSASSDDDGCHFSDVVDGDEFYCDVTNTPIPVTVTVNKEWIYTNASNDDKISDSFHVDLVCDAVIVGGYEIGYGDWKKKWSSEGDGHYDFTVHPTYGGNSCTATESVYDSAVESDNSECVGMDIDIGQGDECTITNTVFFEGIPTLSQYGLAVLALLMLGVGFVGFRRIV